MRARDNPFATDRVQALRYQLPAGLTWEDLLARLASMNHRAALVGPEGSGKTTLLEQLTPRLAARGFHPIPLRLDADQRRLSASFRARCLAHLTRRDFVLLDGAEQLGWLGWLRFQWWARGAGGLVVTAHRTGLLPTLIECRTTPELLAELVGQLHPNETGREDLQLPGLFLRHRGNLRLALRELYDRCAELTAPHSA
jgi:hypothetical protein